MPDSHVLPHGFFEEQLGKHRIDWEEIVFKTLAFLAIFGALEAYAYNEARKRKRKRSKVKSRKRLHSRTKVTHKSKRGRNRSRRG